MIFATLPYFPTAPRRQLDAARLRPIDGRCAHRTGCRESVMSTSEVALAALICAIDEALHGGGGRLAPEGSCSHGAAGEVIDWRLRSTSKGPALSKGPRKPGKSQKPRAVGNRAQIECQTWLGRLAVTTRVAAEARVGDSVFRLSWSIRRTVVDPRMQPGAAQDVCNPDLPIVGRGPWRRRNKVGDEVRYSVSPVRRHSDESLAPSGSSRPVHDAIVAIVSRGSGSGGLRRADQERAARNSRIASRSTGG